MDKNLYDLPPEELKDIPTVCGSLREALTELQNDHAFLLKGDVLQPRLHRIVHRTEMGRSLRFEHTPHPIEFQMLLLGLTKTLVDVPNHPWPEPTGHGFLL